MKDAAFDHHLLDEFLDGVMAMTAAGRMFYWNKGAESVFGSPDNEAAKGPQP